MYKSLLTIVLIQMLSVDIFAEPLNLKINNNEYKSQLGVNTNKIIFDLESQSENALKNVDIEENDKSVIPVVLSTSFLIMSLYGDNSNSSMYRAVGAAATVISFSWYFD